MTTSFGQLIGLALLLLACASGAADVQTQARTLNELPSTTAPSLVTVATTALEGASSTTLPVTSTTATALSSTAESITTTTTTTSTSTTTAPTTTTAPPQLTVEPRNLKTLQLTRATTSSLGVSHDLIAVGSRPRNGEAGSIDLVQIDAIELSIAASIESAHEGAVTALEFTEDGRFLISGGEDGLIRIWDVHDGLAHQEVGEHIGAVSDLSIAGGMLLSASRSGEVKGWRLGGNQLMTQWDLAGEVMSIAWFGDRIIALTSNNEIFLLSDDSVTSIAFVDDAISVMSFQSQIFVSSPGGIRSIDEFGQETETGIPERAVEQLAAFNSPDATHFAIGQTENGRGRVWMRSIGEGHPVDTEVADLAERPVGAAFVPSKNAAVTLGRGGKIAVLWFVTSTN